MTIFGTLRDGADVEAAVEAVLKKWMPTYLAEIARQNGRVAGTLPLPRSYTRVNDFDKFPEDQLPCVVIVAPGLFDVPTREGDGTYRARWSVGVGVIISAATKAATRELAQLYTAAVRGCLLQRPSLEGFARRTAWLDERYDEIPEEDSRSLAAGLAAFWVEVADVTSGSAGPTAPAPQLDPNEEYEDGPVVEQVINTIEAEALT